VPPDGTVSVEFSVEGHLLRTNRTRPVVEHRYTLPIVRLSWLNHHSSTPLRSIACRYTGGIAIAIIGNPAGSIVRTSIAVRHANDDEWSRYMIRRDQLDAPIPEGTVDREQVARFATMAEEWWNPQGRFKTLHQLNPVRLRLICDRIARHFGRNPEKHLPLAGLRVLDIGCGGGLLSEPMAFLGADVVGIDATAKLVHVARAHAAANDVEIDYRHVLAEHLAEAGERFDVIVNTEVIEHVANVDRFVECCCRMIKPGGIMIVATLNRTIKSLVFAKIVGEYVLRLLPKGTHDWNRFIRPHELSALLHRSGVVTTEIVGVGYNPFSQEFRITGNTAVNYIAVAERPSRPQRQVVVVDHAAAKTAP
jgi:2-polyprenyl-6-hydroxyphenyl methylase/3-demethylubiquinone-9 3-methyltransferase